MTHERANRIAWIGWGATLPLAYLGPVVRALTGVRGSGRWPVFAAVGVMLVVLLLIRRDRRALFLAMTMSLSALAIGATGGFVSVALMAGRPLAGLLALKWALGAAFLTWLFRRELHDAGWLPPGFSPAEDVHARYRRTLEIAPGEDVPARLAEMSQDDQRVVHAAVTDEFRRELERDMAAHRARFRQLNARMVLVLGAAAVLLLLVVVIVLRER